MKRFLLYATLALFVVSAGMSCKHTNNESKAVITIVDTLNAPVQDALVRFYLDGSTGNDPNKNTITGLPDTLTTDAYGKVSRTFSNGIVVRLDARKVLYFSGIAVDTLKAINDYIVLQPGETQEKTIRVK
jgi:hypothetical protein